MRNAISQALWRQTLAMGLAALVGNSVCLADDGQGPAPTTPPATGAAAVPAPAAGAPAGAGAFAGKFANEKLTLNLHAAGEGYAGVIVLGGNSFGAVATVIDGQLVGTFTANGQDFKFTATRNGDTVTLISGVSTYALNRADAGAQAVALAPASAPTSGPAGGNPKVMRFVSYSVQDDPTYIGGEAFTILIPVGWKVEGGMEWRPETSLMVQPHLRIYDPHSPVQVCFYPTQSFFWNPQAAQNPQSRGKIYIGDEIQPPVKDQFEAISKVVIARFRPELANAKVVETEKLPKLAQAARNARPPGQGVDSLVGAGRVRLEYEQDGQTVQEDFFVVARLDTNARLKLQNWYVSDAISIRAAKGSVDAVRPVALAIRHSSKPTLAFFNKLNQLQAMRTAQTMDAIKAAGQQRAAMMSKLSSTVSDDTKQQYENQQSGQEAVLQEQSENMREEQPWMTTDGKKVELPYQNDNAWQGANGDFVTSPDPTYDPNTDPNNTSTYTRLEKAPPPSGD